MAELTAGALRCRVEILHRVPVTNDLGTTSYRQESCTPPRFFWASITPSGGSRDGISGDMEHPVVTHRIQCRRSVFPEIPSDLTVRYRGQEYELQYGYPNYRRSGFLDLYFKLVIDHGVNSF